MPIALHNLKQPSHKSSKPFLAEEWDDDDGEEGEEEEDSL